MVEPRDSEPANRWDRHTIVPWFAALFLSGALVLLVELDKRKPDHHSLGVKIIAGIIITLGLAAILRFFVYLIDRGRG
jgi:ABC-type Fe3+-siderophore transport system permease subunit